MTTQERIDLCKNKAKAQGYNIKYAVEAECSDAHNMAYFDPQWAIDEEERQEFPNGREVTVSGDFDFCEEASAIYHITRCEEGVAIGIL